MWRWLRKLWRRATVNGNPTIRVGFVVEVNRASMDEHGDREWYDQLTIMDERMVADEVCRLLGLRMRGCNINVTRGVVLPPDKPGGGKR